MINIKEILISLTAGEKVYYHSNPGNAGDSIIAVATLDLFFELGIEYELISSFTPNVKNCIVIFGGGGYLNEYYFDPTLLNKYKDIAKHLILLPQSTMGFENFLSELGRNVTIFCREEISYKHVLKHAKMANVYLSQDMAFYLNTQNVLSSHEYRLSKIIKKSISFKEKDCVKKKYIWRLLRHSYHYKLRSKGNILNAFRRDVESLGWDIDFENIDISRSFAFTTLSEYKIRASAYNFIHFINSYETVNTDRLHVAICAALLGKKVNFYSNSYFKCEAIYNFSLRENYNNVKWLGKETPTGK